MNNYKSYSTKAIKEDIKKLEIIRDDMCDRLKGSGAEDFFTYYCIADRINDTIDYLEVLIKGSDQVDDTYESREDDIYTSLVDDFDEIKEHKDYIDPIKTFLVNGITNFVETPYFEEFLNTPSPKPIKIANGEIIELIHDFYHSLPDKEIRRIFDKEFSKKESNFRIKGDESNTLILPRIDSYYINVADYPSGAKTAITSVHEYGHVIDHEMRKNIKDYKSNYPFDELPSMFFESLAGIFFEKMIPTSTSIIKEEELARVVELLDASNVLMTEYDGYSKTTLNNPLKYAYLLKKYGKEELECIPKTPALRTFSYVIPYLTSIELQEQYKSDPEKTLHLLKTIIKANDEDNYLTYLENKDIILNSHSSEYIQKKRTLR